MKGDSRYMYNEKGGGVRERCGEESERTIGEGV